MKFLKTKVATVILTASLVLTGANVYAVSALDTNILNLIKDGVGSVSLYFTKEAKNEVENTAKEKKAELTTFIDKRSDQVITDLAKVKVEETERAKGELEAYYNELVDQTNAIFDSETSRASNNIKDTVSTEIEKAKANLEKELESEIEKKLKDLKNPKE
jgi:hypothetical protein